MTAVYGGEGIQALLPQVYGSRYAEGKLACDGGSKHLPSCLRSEGQRKWPLSVKSARFFPGWLSFVVGDSLQRSKHHLLISVTGINPHLGSSKAGRGHNSGCEEPDFENRILQHVYTFPRILIAADYLCRRGLSLLFYQQNKDGGRASYRIGFIS